MLYLYQEPCASTLHLPLLQRYVKKLFPSMAVEVREPFIPFHLSLLPATEGESAWERVAWGFALAKVRDPSQPWEPREPLWGEVNYERRRLADPESRAFGLLYDAPLMAELFRGLLPPAERSRRSIHLVFTHQLIGTWDEDDRRYHARVNLLSFPGIISTSGIVEAPAKPREFYLLKQQFLALRMPDAMAVAVEQEFKGRFIDYEDERLTEVMKGYVMQAILYHLTGEPFCPDKGCRLYNAHWQEEVIAAQLGGDYEFCPQHQRLICELAASLRD